MVLLPSPAYRGFRPYAIGKNISEGMANPRRSSADDMHEYAQIQKQTDREVKDFTEENYPARYRKLGICQSDQKLIKEGYKAPIHDFVIEHPELGDITQEVLEDNGYTFLVIAYNINKTDPENQEKLNRLAAYAKDKGYRFYGFECFCRR